jgi:hypothetical protein
LFGLTIHDEWLGVSRDLDATAAGRMVAGSVELAAAADLIVGGRNLLDGVAQVRVRELVSGLICAARGERAVEIELADAAILTVDVLGPTAVFEKRRGHGRCQREEAPAADVLAAAERVKVRIVEAGLGEPAQSAAAHLARALASASEGAPGRGAFVVVARRARVAALGGRRIERARHVSYEARAIELPEQYVVGGFTPRGHLLVRDDQGVESVVYRSGRMGPRTEQTRVFALGGCAVRRVPRGEHGGVYDATHALSVGMTRHRRLDVVLDGSVCVIIDRRSGRVVAARELAMVSPIAGMLTGCGAVVLLERATDGAIYHVVEPAGWLGVVG